VCLDPARLMLLTFENKGWKPELLDWLLITDYWIA
jgi:hypothetical protein